MTLTKTTLHAILTIMEEAPAWTFEVTGSGVAIRQSGRPSERISVLHVAAMLATGQERPVPDRESEAVDDIKRALAALAAVREALMADVARLERELAGTRGPADAPVGPYAGEVMGPESGETDMGSTYRVSAHYRAYSYPNGDWGIARVDGAKFVVVQGDRAATRDIDGARRAVEAAWIAGGGAFAHGEEPEQRKPEAAAKPEPPKALPYAGQVAGRWDGDHRESPKWLLAAREDGRWHVLDRRAAVADPCGQAADRGTARRAADAAWVKGGGTFAPGAEPEGVGS